jgi:peptide/nickel transport system ATP-binding protein
MNGGSKAEPRQEPLLKIENAVKRFELSKSDLIGRMRRRPRRYLYAVNGVSLIVRRGETLVLLGESGSGKTTLGRLVCGLERIHSGRITLAGNEVKYVRDRGPSRGTIQMVFQDPGASLDPYMSVFNCVAEPLRKSMLAKAEVRSKVLEALELVGLDQSYGQRRARELSGGQKQRVAVARSIVSDPQVVILDEPTSSIDVSIQAQVLNLLVNIQKLKDLTYVLITHDPNVARFMADDIAVMYMGQIVEYGPASSVLEDPQHPYTKALLASVPHLGSQSLPTAVKGDPPSAVNLPLGCRYEPRCPFAMEKCRQKEPMLSGGQVLVACFLYHNNEQV